MIGFCCSLVLLWLGRVVLVDYVSNPLGLVAVCW